LARALAISGQGAVALDEGWRLALSAANACTDPGQADTLDDWVDAPVPGTAAEALRRAGRAYDALGGLDVWYRREIEGQGPRTLKFDGLAGLAEVWLDDRQVLTSRSMYLAHEVEAELSGQHALWICFRALDPELERKAPRARWRPRMIPRQGLRMVRTTLMGRMPGWTPAVEAVGPWRAVTCLDPSPLGVVRLDVTAGFENGRGWLNAAVEFDRAVVPPVLVCEGRRLALQARGDGGFGGRMILDGVEPWWPHTHGAQPLYPVTLKVGAEEIDLGRTGFRDIAVDRGADGEGFQLVVNGVPVFCRGAGWTSADPIGLSGGRDDYAPWLDLARQGGMNMLRMSGTGAYESPAFYALCDELGLLVWQDFMFANFDYPAADPGFAREAATEAAQFLSAIQLSPCLAVLCGGSEALQQAAMMGLKPEALASALHDDILPSAAEAWRPDVPYVVNSPSGGPLPFVVNKGIGHYYGVGAYCRPLEDARRAEVRFAAECLAFANVPQPPGLEGQLAVPGINDPAWKAGVPRDLGASWDFDDVRDHYLGVVYGADPAKLRYADPSLYLDLSRAVTGEVMEHVFAEWRRARSPCAGGLVWTFQDLMGGAGWGMIDVSGEPKPCWYALKRAFRPVQVALTDEGVNGLAVHLTNETGEDLEVEVELTCLREGATPVVSVRRTLTLAARGGAELSAYDLIGRFFDITHAYRFGPPGHDATVVRLRDAGGEVLAEAFHYPTGRALHPPAGKVEARFAEDAQGWVMTLSADRLLQSVHIEDEGFRPDDDWFDLAPGELKRVRLRARGEGGKPSGEIMIPGSRVLLTYSAD
jgi:beta-mannosidase